MIKTHNIYVKLIDSKQNGTVVFSANTKPIAIFRIRRYVDDIVSGFRLVLRIGNIDNRIDRSCRRLDNLGTPVHVAVASERGDTDRYSEGGLRRRGTAREIALSFGDRSRCGWETSVVMSRDLGIRRRKVDKVRGSLTRARTAEIKKS